MRTSDNILLANTSRVLQARLPSGWAIERLASSSGAPRLRISSKEGRSCELLVSALSRPDPRTARQISKERPLLVAAPYLSPSVREVIESEGASYVDQTGNVRVVLDEPGLFIVTSGAASNPWPEQRRFTLRGSKAGRVVCALASAMPPTGVRELAAAAETDPGYVSRLLGMLDREAIVDRTSRGRVERVDWRKLLLRWSEDAPLESRTTATTWRATNVNQATAGTKASAITALLASHTAGCQAVKARCMRRTSMFTVMLLASALTRYWAIQNPASRLRRHGR